MSNIQNTIIQEHLHEIEEETKILRKVKYPHANILEVDEFVFKNICKVSQN